MTQPSPPPLDGWGPIVITPREVYDAVIRLDASVRTLLQSMNQHTEEHVRRDEDIDARFQDHESRIRTVERARWPLPSVAALTGVGGLVTSLIVLLTR